MSDNGRNEFGAAPEGRIAYLESLMSRAEPWDDYTSVFVEYLDDEDPEVRATAIRALWYSPHSNLADRLLELAEHDPSGVVRAQAIGALGIYIYEGLIADFDGEFGLPDEFVDEGQITEDQFLRARDYLLSVYADANRTLDERRFAIESLGFLNDPGTADLIQEAYDRPEKDMKISAIFAMGRNGLKRWNEILARELYNPDSDIQREAIRAVGELGPPELGKDLWRLSYAEDKETQLEAIDALGQSGWEEAFERLEELTLDPDPEVAAVAESALDEWLMWREILEGGDLDDDLDWDESE
jgi:HEAT repeat protein